MDTVEFIAQNKVIAIIRKVYGDDLNNLVSALCKGGLRLVEVTFDQGDADCLAKTAGAIAELEKRFGGEMMIGAGTVLSNEQVNVAAEAGAKYIISPNVSEEVIRHTKKLGLVSIPGAMTPTEMLFAHHCGADYIKVFPYSDLGPGYVKNIMGPINHLKFLATGGVTEQNYPEILKIGMMGAGIGSWLSDKALIADGNFAEFTRRARAFAEMSGNAFPGV